MTVPSTARRAGPFTGTGALVSYPFSFKVFEAADVSVTTADTNGLETPGVLNSTFLVTLNVDQDATPGGSVQYAVGGVATALPTGYRLVITGEGLEYEQPADLPQGGNFDPVVIENALDREMMLLQNLRDSLDRVLQVGVTSSTSLALPAPVAGQLLGWNATLDGLVNYAPDASSAAGLQVRLANPNNVVDGDALLAAKRTIANAIARTHHDLYEQDKYHVFTWFTSAQIADVLAGTNSVDVTAAINAANAAVAALPFGGTLIFATGIYRTTSNISIPNGVSWEGEGYPQTDNAGANWDNGAVIYKAHGGDGVSMVSSNNAGRIKNIGIWSNKTTWATGRGFVVGPAAGCMLDDCTVRTVGGDAFVIGDNTTSSYTNTLHRCYVNNPGGRCFVVGGRYFRGFQLISDGGTVAFETLSLGVSASLSGDCHFEGFTTNGLKLGADAFTTVGRVQTVTYAGVFLTHVSIPSLAAITNIVLSNLDLGSASAGAGSIGVNIGALCTGVRISDSYFGLFEQAIVDNGNRNQVHRCRFFDNGLVFNANGDLYTFNNNICRNTTGSYEIVHNSGTRGIWAENDFQKSINPVVTGVQGDFSGIKVRDNLGYVSRAFGTTGSIASGANISHGLGPVTGGGAVPAGDIVMTTSTAGVTGTLVRSGLAATTFAFTWAGTSPAVWSWSAHLPCDY